MPSLRRTGLTTLKNLAQKSCILIARFSPLIRRVYPDATALHLAMDALNLACGEFVEQANEVLPEGI